MALTAPLGATNDRRRTMTIYSDAIPLHFGYHDWVLTCEHPTSSYGVPVLVAPDGISYGMHDVLPKRDRKTVTSEPIIPWTGAGVVAFCSSWTHPMGASAHAYMRRYLGKSEPIEAGESCDCQTSNEENYSI